MATVIDSLVVTLGLDNKDFQQGVKDTEKGLDDTRKRTERVGKDIAASGKDAAEFFGQMQRSAIKFFAVLTAGKGLINFTRDVVTTGANLSRMSKNMGLSADTMHRWGKAAELNGGSMEGFLGTLQNLNSQMTEIQMTGKSALTPFLQQIGVGVYDAAGKLKTGTQLLTDVATSVESRFGTRQERYSFLTAMGLDENMATMLSQGAKAVKEMVNAQQGFSQADADRAAKADRMWRDTHSRLEALTRELVIKALPALEKLAENFLKLAEVAIPPLSKAVEVFVDLDGATDGWSTTLLIVLGTLRAITGVGIFGALRSMAGFMVSLAGSATALIAPIAALLYSKGLNQGEEEELQRMRGPGGYMGPTYESKGGPDMSGVNDTSPARRNLNPGNLEFAGQGGAVKAGRWAKFKTVEAGVAAMHRQLAKYESEGRNTISKIISKWAPGKENDTAGYIDFVAKKMGIDKDQPISMSNPAESAALISAMAKKESSWTLTERQLWGGIGNSMLTNGGTMSGINGGQVGSAGGNNTVSVGQVVINTPATDARGIAGAFKGEMVRQFDGGSQ